MKSSWLRFIFKEKEAEENCRKGRDGPAALAVAPRGPSSWSLSQRGGVCSGESLNPCTPPTGTRQHGDRRGQRERRRRVTEGGRLINGRSRHKWKNTGQAVWRVGISGAVLSLDIFYSRRKALANEGGGEERPGYRMVSECR